MEPAAQAITFVVGFAAALSAALFYYAWLRPLTERPRLTRVLKLDRRRDVLIVYPPRHGVVEPILPAVSIEDFMAIYNIQRLLVSDGWDPGRIKMRDMAHFGQDPQDTRQNLVLVCAPWRNAVTNEAMQGLDGLLKGHQIWIEDGTPGRHIGFKGGNWPCPTFQEPSQLDQASSASAQGPLNDYALIVSARASQWAGHGPVTIVAGLRGIGTWGAANHLRRHAKQLGKRAGPTGFAMVVSVEYRKWDIADTDEITFVAL